MTSARVGFQAQLDANVFDGNESLNIDACEGGSVTKNLPAGTRVGGLGCGRETPRSAALAPLVKVR